MSLSPADDATRHSAALRAISDLLIPESDLHTVDRANLSTLIELHAEAVDQALQQLASEAAKRAHLEQIREVSNGN